MNNISSALDLAYFAGFFDGDGCISIYRVKPKGAERSMVYHLQARVGNNNKSILNEYKKRFGGCLYKGSNKNKRYWVWGCVSKGAGEFLKQILPYLRVKKERAELALEFRQFLGSIKRRRKPNGQILPNTKDIIDRKEEFRQKMLALNSCYNANARIHLKKGGEKT